jgi:hypothetical protein
MTDRIWSKISACNPSYTAQDCSLLKTYISNGYPRGRGLQVPYQESHLLVNTRVDSSDTIRHTCEIPRYWSAVCCLFTRTESSISLLFVVFPHLFLLLQYVGFKNTDFPELLKHFRRAEPYRLHVYVYRPLDPSAPRFRHSLSSYKKIPLREHTWASW